MADVTLTTSKLKQKAAKQVTAPWEKVRASVSMPRVVRAKEDAPMFSLTELKDPLPDGVSPISEAAISAMTGMVLDLDDISPTEARRIGDSVQRLTCAAVMYPTFSWEAECESWRIVVPYVRTLPVSQHRAAWAGASALLGLPCDGPGNDRSGAKAAQRSYVCSVPVGSTERPPTRVFDGPMIDPEVFVTAGRGAGTVETKGVDAARRFSGHAINDEVLYRPKPDAELVALGCGAVRYFKQTGCAKQGERGLWLLMLAGLRHCAGGQEAAHAWSAKDPRYTPSETTKTLDSLTGGPPTCETISREFTGCKACPHWTGGAA